MRPFTLRCVARNELPAEPLLTFTMAAWHALLSCAALHVFHVVSDVHESLKNVNVKM